jgi:hypothetical protein
MTYFIAHRTKLSVKLGTYFKENCYNYHCNTHTHTQCRPAELRTKVFKSQLATGQHYANPVEVRHNKSHGLLGFGTMHRRYGVTYCFHLKH